ncbi:MAG: hypothetical protein RLZZ385_311 [Pseudomonadota bacterium]
MILKPAQLAAHLRQGLQPLYWVSGDEPLLKQEAADLIRSRCRAAGVTEREVLEVERGFEWQRFSHSAATRSLFGDRKLFELRLSSATLDDTGRQLLQDYVAGGGDDNVVLITSPRLESATLKTKWFKSLESAGIVLQVWPLAGNDLSAWLDARLRSHGIRASGEALQLLVDKVEGNLLAAVQEMEKLKLLANSDAGIELDAGTVLQVVADSSRYNAFQLVDAALAGDGRRGLKILNSLRNEGVHPLPIVGAFNNELLRLLPLLERVQQGEAASAVAQSPQILFSRRQLIGRTLQRLDAERVWRQIRRLRTVDQAVKGLHRADPWDTFADLVLSLAGQLPAHLDAALSNSVNDTVGMPR